MDSVTNSKVPGRYRIDGINDEGSPESKGNNHSRGSGYQVARSCLILVLSTLAL